MKQQNNRDMKHLKFSLTAVVLLSVIAPFTASAQLSAVRHIFNKSRNQRVEIILPKVNGYNVYTADLHTHTIYSDGEITPAMRVEEAWNDGLDIIAITDHMEARRIERGMYRYMKDYIREELRGEVKAINTNLLNSGPDARGVLVDFNIGYEEAKLKGDELGVMVIRGVEITRGKLGDYNALFTTDNNKIYDPDLETSIRNARAQGAYIFHNHPQYSKNTKSTMPEHCEDFYAKGLIDGIEIANNQSYYERLFNYCIEGKYTPFANSDAHNLTSIRYPGAGKEYFRNMTLILAKNCDEKSIRKALDEQRTIAYYANLLIGQESLLAELFRSSVSVEVVGETNNGLRVKVTNHSSLPFSLSWEGKNSGAVYGLSATIINVRKGTKELEITPTNMFYGKGKSPIVSFKLD